MNSIVSIITPSFNSVNYICHTIESILNQSYKNWELIIIDDCSTDDSCTVIQKYVDQDSRIKLIKLEENSGAAIARNIGIKHASGRFIAFLDSDDTWHPEKLEKQIKFMLDNQYYFTYTGYRKVDENGAFIKNAKMPKSINYNKLLKTNYIGCLTAIYDSEKLGKIYFPLIRKRQDYALWLKILKIIPNAYGLQEDLANYTVRSDSISANKLNVAKYNWTVYREVEKLSLIHAIYCFINYAILGILRK
ncbi:glycosyltransferase family 2 protein [Acinetobacter pseudolwoffii]|uniref:Glycosyl transferase n=1 Tax=Acinetobacter pseudolwoffii TaxID=2053287 RepID=A0A2H9ULK4_9GAMM|nr:glycosyltransferase family 2 protein [Acinetobacter pseudolwoffii]PJI32571.1 glycosyl transferase [Acinetobacter pseudolwoffii]